ncbi:MAG: glutaredoxin domain-containing protein [Leptospirillia bacterium]
MKDILIYSTRACPYCVAAKRALDERGIPYREIDITLTPHVRDELSAKTGEWTVPQVFVDGEYIGQDDELVAMVKAGTLDPETAEAPKSPSATDAEALYDAVVIGAGQKGLAVAEQLAGHGRIAVFYRDPYIAGADPEADLTRAALTEAGVAVERREVFGLQPGDGSHRIMTLEDEVRTRTVVIATGGRDRAPDIPGEAALAGKGVSRCVECDGAFFTGLPVALAGSDERAAEAACNMAITAESVDFIVPEASLGVSETTRERLAATPNLRVHTGTQITKIEGEHHVTGLVLHGPDGTRPLTVSGVFLYLTGNRPATGFMGGAVPVGGDGVIPTGNNGETPVSGLFAVGDPAGSGTPESVADTLKKML